MKLLYAHDHKFYKYKSDYYSNGSFPKEILVRYTNLFEDVTFISRQILVSKKPEEMSLATTDRVRFIKVPNFKSLKQYHKRIEASKIIENQVKNADCIIVRLPSSIGNIAVKYAIKYNKPYAIEVVGCPWDALWNYGNVQGKILAPISYYNMKRLVKEAKYVSYVTKEFLQKRYPSKGITTNCSNVSIGSFDENIIKERISRIEINKDKMVFGSIGALSSKYKGFDIAIKALSIVRNDTNVDIEYRILGGGNQNLLKRIAIKYGMEDIVKFDGTLPSGEPVLNWLDNIDIYIQPSRTEGLPRATIEAMSRGCPTIGSNVGGIPELLEKDSIFNKTNYKELAELLYMRLTNSNLMNSSSIRNFNEAKKYHKEIIEVRRSKFLKEFRKSALTKY